ncbi:MAG: hypothetical protein RLN62_04270 [Rickettsiales bacterium]
MTKSKIIIAPIIGRGFDESFDAFVNLVEKYGKYSHANAYALVSAAYLSDEYVGIEVNALGFTKNPGTISQYKIGELTDYEFIDSLREKLPVLEKAHHQEIIDAWALMSLPTTEISTKYCAAIKHGYKFMFVSYTNNIQAENFKDGLHVDCPEFKEDEHYYAVSYKSPNKFTNHHHLAYESLSENHLTDQCIFSCHLGVHNLQNAEYFTDMNQELSGCLDTMVENAAANA